MPDVRLSDVARRAGVSSITVSRALRSPDKLTPETRARVSAAMLELGYVPNLIAGALASARTQSVAMLLPTIDSSIFTATVEGLSAELEPRGYAILLAQSGYDPVREERVLRALLSRRPEALVMVGSPATEASAELLRRADIPIVEVWDLPEKPIDAAVGFDNRAAGAAVARFFLDDRRRRFAFVGGRDSRALMRLQGFTEAIAQAGCDVPVQVNLPSPPTADVAATHAAELSDFDAVFCATDVCALGVLTGLRTLGRRVPEDVAVVGLGDFEITRHAIPTLTSVRIDGREIGRRAAALILSPDRHRRIDLGFEIIRRESA